MRAFWSLTAALGASALLSPVTAWAHTDSHAVAGDGLQIDTRNEPAKHKLGFKTSGQPEIFPVHDPAAEGASVLLRWDTSGGRTELITLDPALWSGLGNPVGSSGWKYKDKDGTRGGITQVLWKAGMLKIQGKGAGLDWELPTPVDSVWVEFRVADETLCAEFGGDIKKNGDGGSFLAKDAPAPNGGCEDQVCGNGVLELGEDCDDGNLDQTDACLNDCSANPCAGEESYDGTFAAIQAKIFEDGGCTNGFCHDSSGPAGGLNLSAGSSWANLVNVDAAISSLDRVEPGDEALSFLYEKIAGLTLSTPVSAGSPMPAGGLPAISVDHLAALRLWIRAGAPETGTVLGTEELLGTCLPAPQPNKMQPLAPPAAGEGVQWYAPPWDLPANSEDEICYATYYDFSAAGVVPASAQVPCPNAMGGPLKTCVKWDQSVLAQDPQSHHSLINAYVGAYDWTNSGWGGWTCKGGDHAGESCDPTRPNVALGAGGGTCGARAGCTRAVETAVACLGFGPPDMGFNPTGGGTATSPRVGGSQEALSSFNYPDPVAGIIPIKGYVVWNSHAFNLTDYDTTIEQWQNYSFAGATDDNLVSTIFDADHIFIQSVPPFEKRTYCGTYTIPQFARLFEISSHVHRFGELFRIWLPPNENCTPGSTCVARSDAPAYVSTEYNDPVQLYFDPPVAFDTSGSKSRRFLYCSTYDNGADDPAEVKRYSTSPSPPPLAPGGPCSLGSTRCLAGPQKGQVCAGNHAFCDSAPEAGDGVCDACTVTGGVTTEDEMFILLGSYYVPSASRAFLDTPGSLVD